MRNLCFRAPSCPSPGSLITSLYESVSRKTGLDFTGTVVTRETTHLTSDLPVELAEYKARDYQVSVLAATERVTEVLKPTPLLRHQVFDNFEQLTSAVMSLKFESSDNESKLDVTPPSVESKVEVPSTPSDVEVK